MRMRLTVTVVLLSVLSVGVTGLGAQEGEYPPMAAFGADGNVWLYGFENEPQQVVFPEAFSLYPYSLDWSPDGTLLAFTADVEVENLHLLVTDLVDGHTEMVVGDIWLALPISWSIDGESILYPARNRRLFDTLDIFRIEPHSGAIPELVGTINYVDYCAGSGNYPTGLLLWQEAGIDEWNQPDVLEETPFGIVHTSTCAGGDLRLFDPKTGTDADIPHSPIRVVLSPDRTRIAGTSRGNIVLVDLETLDFTIIEPESFPQLLAWGSDDTILYSSQRERENLSDRLTDVERQIIRGEEILAYDIEIRQIQLADGSERVLYQADAYAVGRLMPSPNGDEIFFSQIPNLGEWLNAVVSGTIPFDSYATEEWFGTITPSLYRLDLTTGDVELIGAGLYKATINFPAYERMMPQSDG